VFEYFPGNYVWNLAVVAALNNAARGISAGTTRRGRRRSRSGWRWWWRRAPIGLDDLPYVSGYVADWVSDVLSSP
jgi:hypothetical protein